MARPLAATALIVTLFAALVGVGAAADFLIRHVCAAVCEAPLEE